MMLDISQKRRQDRYTYSKCSSSYDLYGVAAPSQSTATQRNVFGPRGKLRTRRINKLTT